LRQIKKPDLLFKLLKCYCVCRSASEILLNELAQLTGTNVPYEWAVFGFAWKNFWIFRLKLFSAEIWEKACQGVKNLFLRCGNPKCNHPEFSMKMQLRKWCGGLWETFASLDGEWKLTISFHRRFVNTYFWLNLWSEGDTTTSEENDGLLHCFEFKYSDLNSKENPKRVSEKNYPNSTF